MSNRMIRRLGVLLLLGLLPASAFGQRPGAPGAGQGRQAAPRGPRWDVQLPEGAGTYPTGDLFIRNLDAVWTATGRVLEGTSILIRDGVIAEIGPDLVAPEGVEIIEGVGITAIPRTGGRTHPHRHGRHE